MEAWPLQDPRLSRDYPRPPALSTPLHLHLGSRPNGIPLSVSHQPCFSSCPFRISPHPAGGSFKHLSPVIPLCCSHTPVLPNIPIIPMRPFLLCLPPVLCLLTSLPPPSCSSRLGLFTVPHTHQATLASGPLLLLFPGPPSRPSVSVPGHPISN